MVVRELIALLGFKTDDKSLRKVETSMDRVAAGAVKLSRILLTGAAAAGFSKLIDLASESAETLNKFGAVFGSSQDMVQKQLDKTSKNTGVASLQLQQFAASIGAIVKPALGSAVAAGKVGATMAELALDIASFNDVEPDQALIALRSGLIGSAEPLQRFGVDVRVAALEQEALRLGIRGSLKEMSEGQRIQIRTSAILRQLGSQGALGDATTTAKDFANASRALSSQIKQLGASIGTFFLKDAGRTVAIFTKIVTVTNDWLRINKEVIQQRVDKVLQVINNTIEGLVRVLFFAVDGWRMLNDLLGPVGSGLLTVTGILLTLIAILGAPIVLLLAIGAAIGLVIDDLVVFANGGKSAFGLLLNNLQEFLGGFDSVGELFEQLLANALQFWDSFFVMGEEQGEGFGERIFTILTNVWEGVLTVWDELTGGFFDGAFEKVKAFALSVADRATEIFQTATDRVGDFLKENAPKFIAFLKDLSSGVVEFVRESFSGTLGRLIIDFLGAKAGAAVGQFVGEFVGKLAGQIAGKGIVGRLLASSAGEALFSQLGKIGGGIAGAIIADTQIGSRLPELLGTGGAAVGASPALSGGSTFNATTGNMENNFNITGGSGTPEQVGDAVAAKVQDVMQRERRQTLQQLTTAGATP